MTYSDRVLLVFMAVLLCADQANHAGALHLLTAGGIGLVIGLIYATVWWLFT